MQEFIAISPVSKELLNSATLIKTLNVNTLIIGNKGNGKKSLASYILPHAKIYKANELQRDINDKVYNLNNKSIIIENIEELTNIELFLTWVSKNEIFVVATTQKQELNSKLKEFFSITLFIPDLENRREDIQALANKFSLEAKEILCAQKKPDKLIMNINQNAISLRKSIYFSYLFDSISENEIMMLLEKFMFNNFEGENSYKDFSYLFEIPILKAAQKKYKSQLQMSKYLGINRITLRKKLDIYKEMLI